MITGNRSTIAFGLLGILLAAYGVNCTRPPGSDKDMLTVGRDVPLKAACAFDAKLEILCMFEGLDLQYYGELGRKWREGLAPGFSYNEWYVRLFHADNSESRGAKPGDRLRLADTHGDIPKGITERALFYLRMGHFGKGPNTIPIRMGPHEFDIIVFDIEGDVTFH